MSSNFVDATNVATKQLNHWTEAAQSIRDFFEYALYKFTLYFTLLTYS